MKETGVTQGPFRVIARLPDDMASLPADGDWAAWFGLRSAPAGERRAVVLVSISVTAFHVPGGGAAGAALGGLLRRRYPADALVEEFSTPAGNPAASVRMAATSDVRGNPVTTGQAQVLVVFPKAGALGVVSGMCLHPDDLDTAAALVAEVAARMSVEWVAAAA